MKNKVKLGLVAGLCALMLACGNNGKSGKVVFESEDKKIKIYESEVNYQLQKNLEATGVSEKDLTADELLQMKLEIIQSIALGRAVALEGKNQKIDKNKSYTDGIEMAKESLLAAATIAERSKNVDVTEAKLREVYEANKASFERKENTVKLQIAILSSANKAKAETALKEAIANPAKFDDVVKKYSEANDGANGQTAEIPVSTLENQYGPISEAISDVSAGQVVNRLITVGNELYIVKVIEKLPKGYIEFDKVKKQIQNQVVAQEKQAKSQSFIQEVTGKYKLDKISKDTVKLTK